MMHTLLYIGRTYHGRNSGGALYDYSPTLYYTALLLPIIIIALVYIIMTIKSKNTLNGDLLDPNVIVLAALIVKADNQVGQVELQKIKSHLAKNLSQKKAKSYYELFKEAVKTDLDLKVLIDKTNYDTVVKNSANKNSNSKRNKVKWMHFLISVAVADRLLSNDEFEILEKIRKGWKLPLQTFNSILAMFNYYTEEELNRQKTVKQYKSNSIDRYYKVLGVSSSATVNDIKSAYRDMVKLYHPDKQIGKKLNKNTKVRFHQVQDAYEAIKKHRRM